MTSPDLRRCAGMRGEAAPEIGAQHGRDHSAVATARFASDAAVLARCLAETEGDDIEGAFKRYEAHRKPRTSVVQAISSANTWMKEGNADTSWLYGYDAWTAPLDQPAAHAIAA